MICSSANSFIYYYLFYFCCRVLLGKDDEEIVVAARFLMNYIPTEKTVIFALCLKDYQPQTLRQIGQRLQTHLSPISATSVLSSID